MYSLTGSCWITPPSLCIFPVLKRHDMKIYERVKIKRKCQFLFLHKSGCSVLYSTKNSSSRCVPPHMYLLRHLRLIDYALRLSKWALHEIITLFYAFCYLHLTSSGVTAYNDLKTIPSEFVEVVKQLWQTPHRKWNENEEFRTTLLKYHKCV